MTFSNMPPCKHSKEPGSFEPEEYERVTGPYHTTFLV